MNYCSVHDNQDLFDAVQLKSSYSDSIATRARRQVLAMSLIELGQGIPFFQAGDDMLAFERHGPEQLRLRRLVQQDRLERRRPPTGASACPSPARTRDQWSIMQPLLSTSSYTPLPANIASTTAAFQEFLRIRYSSGLFRMATESDIQHNLTFLNTGSSQTPGLIVMKLDQNAGQYNGFNHILVVFNATNATSTFTDTRLQGLHLHLHPVQQFSSDPTVRQSTFNGKQGTVSVPALTTAVFVQ